MTFKRGMRRLALFVGVLGAIAGGFASYFELQSLLQQRTRHNAFEQLANSVVVQQERKRLQNPQRFVTDPKTGVTFDMSKAVPVTEWDAQGNPISKGHNGAVGFSTPTKSTEGWVISDSPVPSPPLDHSDVNKDGIKSILWARNYEVKSLETEDGQTVVPEPLPGFLRYLLPLTFPILGFLLPWGLVSALVWVGAGFFETAKLIQ